MALRFKINGVDFTTKWRPYESSWTQRAWQGESSQSRFILDDDDGTINHATLAARKIVTVEEDASGSWVTLYRGRMMSHSVARGTIIAGVAARWTLTTEDSNIDARGIRVDSSTRPEESDRERVLAYVAGYLNGASSTNPNARDSTDIDGTYVENIDLVTMPAETYTDTYPNEVFNRIVEISAKVWFVYVADDGTMHMFYATKDTATIQADIEIWDNDPTVLDDDPDRYAPDRSVTVGNHDGQALISGGSVRYGDDQFYEYSHAGSEADHDKWEAHFTDQLIINAGSAEAFLENMVASLNNEEFSFTVRIRMTAANVHRLKAGMMTAIRLVAANLPTVTDQRAVEVTVEPKWPDENGDAFYWVTATFGIPRGKPFPRKIRTRPGPFPASPTDPGTPATPDTVVAAWHFDTGNATTTQHDDTATYPVSGKWNSAGYAYSTNLTTQVATHSKSPKPAAVAGTQYRISGRMRNRDLVRNPNGLSLIMGFKDGSGTTIPTPVNVGNTGATENQWVSVSGTATAPGGTAFVVWGVSSTAAGTDFTVAGTLADVDDVVISEVGTGTPAVPGSGGINDDLIGDPSNQYAEDDHTHLVIRAAAPTDDDDVSEGYPVGTEWQDSTTGKTYLLLDNSAGAAEWLELLNENWVHSHDEEDVTLSGAMAGLLAGNAFLYFVHRDNAGDYQLYLLAGTDGENFDTVLGPEPQFTPITTGAEARDGGLIKWRGLFYGFHTGGTAGSGNERFTVYVWDDGLDNAPTFVASPGFSGSISGVTAVWAPKPWRDPEQSIDTRPYVLFAGADGGSVGAPSSFAPYYVQATADDLAPYSAATAITGTGFPAEAIDPFIAYIPEMGTAGSPYKLFLVDDGAAKTVGVWESATPFTGYVALDSDLAWSATDHEAPVVIDMGDGRWRGYYNKHSGFDSLGAFYRDWTPDGGWGAEVAVTTPWLEAHGTVVRIADEFSPVEDAGVSDHGALSGLADDDHPQYVLTTALDAAIAAAGHYEVIVSGTAPPVAVTNVAEDDWLYGFVS
jgi:hypothetical protein